MTCLISFVWDQSTSQERIESGKIQNQKSFVNSGTRSHSLRFVARFSTDWASRALINAALSKLPLNIHVLPITMHICINWYKFANEDVERILHAHCVVLHFGIYLYLTNIKETHKSCVCFQLAHATKHSTLSGNVWSCTLKTITTSLCYMPNIDIFQYVTQTSRCTRQNTLYIILELKPMYTLVSEVRVCLGKNRSTEGCSKLKSPETGQIQERLVLREKEGDLIQSYDKTPYTNRKFENQRTTQKRHQNLRLHNDCGPT